MNTFLGIHFLQDQMASYEIEPGLLESVTMVLVKEMKTKLEEKKLPPTTAMSEDAEKGCITRIEQYRKIYLARKEEKERERIEQEMQS